MAEHTCMLQLSSPLLGCLAHCGLRLLHKPPPLLPVRGPTGMEVVKCSTWEEPFRQRIQVARGKELGRLLLVTMLQALTSFLVNAIPVIVPVVTFAAYIALGKPLSAAEAFTSLAL